MNGPSRERRRGPKGPNRRPPSGGPNRNPLPPGRTLGFWIVVVLMLLFAMQLVMSPRSEERPITYTTFERQLEGGNLAEVTVIDSREVRGRLLQPQVLPLETGANEEVENFVTTLPFSDPDLIGRITEANPDAEIRGETSGMNWWSAILSYLPFILLIGIWLFFLRQMQSGGNRAFSFGKSKAKLGQRRPSPGDLRRRGRLRGGQGRPRGSHRVPQVAAEVPAPRRPHPHRRPHGRAPGDGQDAPCEGRGR